MLNPISFPSIYSENNTAEKTTKSIVFKVLNTWFALPIEAILRIINCPPLNSPIKDCLGLTEWDRQTITVIDLASKIQAKEPELEATKHSANCFLILTQTQSAELCGFLSYNSPLLIDIPLASIRLIPSSYRQVTDLNVINKMAILPLKESEQSLQILLLGNWN